MKTESVQDVTVRLRGVLKKRPDGLATNEIDDVCFPLSGPRVTHDLYVEWYVKQDDKRKIVLTSRGVELARLIGVFEGEVDRIALLKRRHAIELAYALEKEDV